MSEGLISFPTNLWTIQDVLIDSPVWKSNILHLEEQIDHFEKWVEGFMKSLKQYVDAVIKYNAQTSNLCKKILPQNLDGSLIDPQVAGMIINTFASALQCNLAFKTKLVSDLEDNLLHPLQRFVKHELKDFKEARKTYERISDKYESQIFRYNALSRAKEASALREDAFQTYDVRKTFIRVSREYYAHLLSFKVRLEHVLVECFSSATSAQVEETNEAHQSCTQARTMLPGWQQWLEESKAMSEYQLEKIDKASQKLENGLVRKLRPYRSLRNYITPLNSGMLSSSPAADDVSGFADHTPSPRTSQINMMGPAITTTTNEEPMLSKEGYLFTRIVVGKPARYSWIRRWFFIQDGWFGACAVSTVDKVKGCVVIADRVRVSDCTCRINNDIDRRFLFEVVTESNNSIILQAETEDELQSWMKTFENLQQHEQKQKDKENGEVGKTAKNDNNKEIPGPLLGSKFYLDITQLNKGPITMSNSPALTALGSQSRELVPGQSTISRLISIMVGNGFSESSETLNARSSSPDSIVSANNNTNTNNDNNNNDNNDNNNNNNTIIRNGDSSSSSSSSSSTPPPPPPPLPSSSSLSRNNTLSSPTSASSWTMPWIMSGFLANNNNSSSSVDVSFYGTQDGAANGFISLPKGGEENGIVIFPTRIEMEAIVVHLNGYTGELASRQRELRRLFSNVPESEIVIEAFSASLYRQAGGGTSIDEDNEEHDHTHITSTPSPRTTTTISSSSTGYFTNEYGYSGHGYVTQNYLWFYHCSLMTCINTVVIPLDSIKSVRLEKALSNASHGMLMFVETKSTPPKTFCFGIWLEPAEVVGERLKMAIEASKNPKKNDLQKLYDHMKAVIPEKIKSKQRPTSHLMHATSLGATLTPLNVQAQPPSPQQHPSTSSVTIKNTLPPLEDKDNTDHEQQQQQQQQTPKKSISEQSTSTANHRHSAAAGALTAAMEAAKQQSSTSSSTNNTAESSPGKNKKYKKKKREMSIVDHQEYNDRMKPLPKGPVDCDCEDHLDKVEAKLQLSISAEKLFGLMFSDKQSGPDSGSNSLWAKLNRVKQNSEPQITEWEPNSEGIRERTLKYVMPLNNPMVKTRDTDVIETQQIHVENTRICYVVISSTKTPSLPYSDAFAPIIKFCITYISQNSCQLSCSIGVKWLKSIMVKSMVSRAATKGMTDTIRALVPLVEHEVLLLDKENVPTARTKTITKDEIERPMPPLPASPKVDKISSETYRKKILIPSVGRLFIICVIILVFYALFKRYHPRHHQSLPTTTNSKTQITWRAVFLRDLENGLIDNNNQNDTTSTSTIHPIVSPPDSFLKHANPTLYHLFEQQYYHHHNRRHLDNNDANNKGWFSMQHRLMGAELTYTRERLGALRYELLTAFKMLNTMDQRILENEYWNWILDERLRCEHTDDNNNDVQNKDTCNQIIKEVKLAT